MIEHKAHVVPSRGYRDRPFKAVCSCGWGTEGVSSASVADGLKGDHLLEVAQAALEYRPGYLITVDGERIDHADTHEQAVRARDSIIYVGDGTEGNTKIVRSRG